MSIVKNNFKVSSSSKNLELTKEDVLFVNAFCKMDVDSLINLLEEDLDYGNENQWSFIESIRNKMEFFKLRKDTSFINSNGLCSGCSIGKEVLVFKGNNSGLGWSFCLESEGDVIKSIYECGLFKEIC